MLEVAAVHSDACEGVSGAAQPSYTTPDGWVPSARRAWCSLNGSVGSQTRDPAGIVQKRSPENTGKPEISTNPSPAGYAIESSARGKRHCAHINNAHAAIGQQRCTGHVR
jgi:hypothetical protein